jgi:hypothetical protein
MSKNDLIGQVPKSPAEALKNWRTIREKIHSAFDQAPSEPQRVALLALYCSVMNMAEQAIRPEELEKFREIRGHGYSMLIVKECLVGENVNVEKADAVMRREIAAGRMAPDHILLNKAELAKSAAQHIRTQRLLQENAPGQSGLWRRIVSWLVQ